MSGQAGLPDEPAGTAKLTTEKGPVLSSGPGRLVTVVHRRSKPVAILVAGERADAFEGESLLCAILRHRGSLRFLEFGGEPRAGFCLMGACQDCWVGLAGGARVRACTTEVRGGMDVRLGASDEPAGA